MMPMRREAGRLAGQCACGTEISADSVDTIRYALASHAAQAHPHADSDPGAGA